LCDLWKISLPVIGNLIHHFMRGANGCLISQILQDLSITYWCQSMLECAFVMWNNVTLTDSNKLEKNVKKMLQLTSLLIFSV
jgi:hypothetical protein